VYSVSPIAEAKLTVPGRARGAAPATAPRPVVAWIAQGAAVAALLVVAMLARRPGWMLDRSYWLDEGWVADSLRAPLHQLLFVSSSTPIGWTLLLRAVPRIGAPEYLRLLPLAFGVAGVVPAYLLGRMVGRAPAMAAGLAAAIGPVALMPHGLKQYTADAFVALLLLWLAARLEADWSERRLLLLGAVCAPAILLSHTTLFVTVAVFAALTLRNVIEWRLSRLAWVLGVGASVGVLQVVAYFTLLSVGDNPAMRRWWVAWYVPVSQGPGRAVAFVVTHTGQALTSLGLGPWALALGLVVLGLVALARKGLLGVALSVPLLFVLQVVAAAGRYPFMDPRTSMFFTVVLTVCAGIGLGAVAGWALARWRTAPLALALTAGAGLLVAPAVAEARRMDMPPSTVRQQVEYVLAHRRPGDVVVPGFQDIFAFAYYWPDRPTFSPTRYATALVFQVDYPDRSDVMVCHERTQEGIDTCFRLAAAHAHRIWVITAGGTRRYWTRASRSMPSARVAPSPRSPILIEFDAAQAPAPRLRPVPPREAAR
jgi:hypothetical protein